MMSLQEAIEHCHEKAQELQCTNGECAADHRRLEGWLIELEQYRAGMLNPDAMQQFRLSAARTAMGPLLSDGEHLQWLPECVAEEAVKYADALIDVLWNGKGCADD